MDSHRVAGAPLDFAALRDELEVPGDFSAAALADASGAADARSWMGSAADDPDGADDIPFVTVDPAGSRDLDQAVHIARTDGGYLVSYAIADVASFVPPDSALDAETQRRGETLYFPDVRVPLHPPSLSEDAASLLPGRSRPAVLWQVGLDAAGEVTAVDVRRARVRSRAQLDYPGLQKAMTDGSAPEAVALLGDVGTLRIALARSRHAINLDLPEQRVEGDAQHGWTLALRAPLPVELYNAEISLLVGMCAAKLMLDAGYGILRTVPPADARSVKALRRAAHALGVAWPDGAGPGDVLATVDRTDGKHVAFIEHAVSLLRGAGYTAFDGAAPTQPLHAGIGAPYAHVTAPLRRLVDRYGSEICLAAQAKAPIPRWVRERMPQLPDTMQLAERRAHAADRAVVDMTEAWLLQDRVGQTFTATVIDADDRAGTVVLDEPAVRARCEGSHLPVGEHIDVRLAEADVSRRIVRFVKS
ncbi:MAG: ribonuclease II [Pseudonocardiales bacterium]|nr:MAG: ribonuclease II [Pseudonocardiales bacterium]